MVPLPNSLAQVFGRKTPLAIRSCRRERFYGRGSNRKHIAVGGKPIGLFFVLFLVLFFVAMVEHLHLDARGERPAFAFGQSLDGFRGGPDEDPGVAAGLQMTPLRHQLEMCVNLIRPDYTGWLACAMHHP